VVVELIERSSSKYTNTTERGIVRRLYHR